MSNDPVNISDLMHIDDVVVSFLVARRTRPVCPAVGGAQRRFTAGIDLMHIDDAVYSLV